MVGDGGREPGATGSRRRELVPDERGERERVERLCHVRQCSEASSALDVLLLDLAAQKNQGDVSGSLVPAQPRGKLEAVETGHPHVGEDEVRFLAACLLEPLEPVCGFEHAHSSDAQVDRAEQPDSRVIVDDQDAP